MKLARGIATLAAIQAVHAAVYLRDFQFGAAPRGTLTPRCEAALHEFPIDCDDGLKQYRLNDTLEKAEKVCTPGCERSLEEYLAQAMTACVSSSLVGQDCGGCRYPAWEAASEQLDSFRHYCQRTRYLNSSISLSLTNHRLEVTDGFALRSLLKYGHRYTVRRKRSGR
jgi:hypothetical protein